jgi:hypothetical protein
VKHKIEAFFREYETTSVDPATFFASEDPNEIAEELGKFSRSEFKKITDENDGAWQLSNFLAAHPRLNIRGLILTNDWWRDCVYIQNSFIGDDAFLDGMSPAEEAFKCMSLGEQINAFLATVGAVEDDSWRISDALELSSYLKLEGDAAEIRDHLVVHMYARMDDISHAMSSGLFKILIVVLTDTMKKLAMHDVIGE